MRSGDLTQAQARAEELEILSPGDPWVKLVKGWAAYRRVPLRRSARDQRFDACHHAVSIPSATVLKARALVSMQREDEAIDLLNKQIQAQPTMAAAWRCWRKSISARIIGPKWPSLPSVFERSARPIRTTALLLVEAAFRSGNVELGAQGELSAAPADAADAATVDTVLDLWTDYWPSPQRIADARRLAAAAAGLEQRLTYAEFLSRCGSPADAIRLADRCSDTAGQCRKCRGQCRACRCAVAERQSAGGKGPVRCRARVRPGQCDGAARPSRAELRTGNAAAAVLDAQKLVTVLPNSGGRPAAACARLCGGRNKPWMDRTLWTAFQDIPADEHIFAALQSTKKGDRDAIAELNAEFARQRDAKLNRGLL